MTDATTFRERFKDAMPTACACRYEDNYHGGRWLIPRGHQVHNGYFGRYIDRYVFEDQDDLNYYQRVSAWRLENKDPFGLPKKPRYGWREAFLSLWRDAIRRGDDTPASRPRRSE